MSLPRVFRTCRAACLAFSVSATLPATAQQIPTTMSITLSPANPTSADAIVATISVSPSGACNTPTDGGTSVEVASNVLDFVEQYRGGANCPTFNVGKLSAGPYFIGAAFPGTGGPNQYPPIYASSGLSLNFTVAQAGGTGFAAFNGYYAFLFQGVTVVSGSKAVASTAMGEFIADGNGSITSGTVDFVTLDGVAYRQPLTGSYSLDLSGRGTLTLTNSSFGTQSFSLSTQAKQAASSYLQSATMTPVGGALRGSAQIEAISVNQAKPGQYVVDLSGVDSNTSYSPVSLTGLLQLDQGSEGENAGTATIDWTADGFVQQGIQYSLNIDDEDRFTYFFGIQPVNLSSSAGANQSLQFDALPIDDQHLFMIQLAPNAQSKAVVLSGTASGIAAQ